MAQKQLEWVDVTVIKPLRKKAIDNGKAYQMKVLDHVTFSQSCGKIIVVIEGRDPIKKTFEALLSQDIQPTEGLILGYQSKGISLSLEELSSENRQGKVFAQKLFEAQGFSGQGLTEVMNACEEYGELGSLFTSKIKNYTLVERAQLLLSIMVHSSVDYLCLDDSLMFVTRPFFLKVMSTIQGLAKEGKSIWVFSDHLPKLSPYCDQLMWIEFGKLKQFGKMSDVQPLYDAHLLSIQEMSLEEQRAYWKTGHDTQLELVEPDSPSCIAVGDKIEVEPEQTEVEKDIDGPENTRSNRREELEKSSKLPKKFSRLFPVLIGVICSLVLGITIADRYIGRELRQSQKSAPYVKAESREAVEVSLTSTTFSEERRSSSENKAIQRGDSLSSSTVSETSSAVTSESSQLPETSNSSTQRIVEVAPFNHQVVKGESLYTIASGYGVSVDDLKAANELAGDQIDVGMKLSLPVAANKPNGGSLGNEQVTIDPALNGETHAVASGDTLYGVAKRYGTDVQKLQEANGMATTELSLGQVLVIP